MKLILFIISFLMHIAFNQDCTGFTERVSTRFRETKQFASHQTKYKVVLRSDDENRIFLCLSFSSSSKIKLPYPNALLATFSDQDQLKLNFSFLDHSRIGSYHGYCIGYQISKLFYEKLKSDDIRDLFFDYKSLNIKVKKGKGSRVQMYLSCLESNMESSVSFDQLKTESTENVEAIEDPEENFIKRYDEFKKATFYFHKRSGINSFAPFKFYLYFSKTEVETRNLRLYCSYRGVDWIFFEYIYILVGDEVVSFKVDTETDVLEKRVVETADEQINESTLELLSKIDIYDKVKIRLSGKYEKDYIISKNQKTALIETISYWKQQ